VPPRIVHCACQISNGLDGDRELTEAPEWKKYQTEVAEFLSQIGFATATDVTLEGARASHDVDVTARISLAGIDQLWLVECKRWQRPVPKERALTFIGVVDDVGADRGLIFSESGFQAGAIRAVQNTNVTLTSLTDFEQNSAEEVASARARVLDERIAVLLQKFTGIWDIEEADRKAAIDRYIGPSSLLGIAGTGGVTARLSHMRTSLEHARFNRWPVSYYPLDSSGAEFIDVKDWIGLFFVVEETIATCEKIYDHMIDPGVQATDWKDFQSYELTELLHTIRASNTLDADPE
jgi:hypothetical protein